MKRDKLTIRGEIQADFGNETVENINKAIAISKVIRFIYKESTIFFLSMIPMLIVGGYSLIVDKNPLVGIVLILAHYPFYRFFVKGFIFKDAKNTYDEFDYTIEVMEEIKSDKVKI